MFRAYDAEQERLVAVKLFKLDLPPERVHQLVSEFEQLIAADLTHPALVRPVATGMSGVAAYLAQEYVAAESLDLAVREYGPAPASDALRVAAQLAGALDFAAVVNIHHGALHPRDVLLSSDETRLTGVGVAQALLKVGVAAPVRRPYTPPERLDGGALDGRADVFGLAAVIYELLSGKRISGAGARAVDALAEIPGGDAAAVQAVFRRALAENPSERYATALEFVDALKQAFPQSSVASLQSPVKRTRPKTDDRRPTTDDRRPATDEPLLPLDQPEATDRVDLEIVPPVAAPLQGAAAAATAFDVAEVFKPDLPLAAAEQQRYEDVEVAPVVTPAAPLAAEDADAAQDQKYNVVTSAPVASAATAPHVSPHVYTSALEQTRSAIWPLLLALGVGVAVGFAAGYGVGNRDRSAAAAAAPTTAAAAPAPAATPAAAPVPAGKDFTENAVKPADSSVRVQADQKPPAPEVRLKPDTTAARGAGPGTAERGAGPGTAERGTGPGRLLIRSTPAGARVTVDERDAGVTPAVVRNLATGPHQVRLERDGYATADRRIVLTRERPAQSMIFPLVRERVAARGTRSAAPAPETPGTMGRFAGALSVDSRPSGAKVFLDGRLIGTTPLALPSIQAGEHAVRLERDGYRRWTSSVRVVASEQNRITASLER